jgi:hypothetical protein
MSPKRKRWTVFLELSNTANRSRSGLLLALSSALQREKSRAAAAERL